MLGGWGALRGDGRLGVGALWPAARDARTLGCGRRQDRCLLLVGGWLGGWAALRPYQVTSTLCKAVHFGELDPDEGAQVLRLAQMLGVRLVLLDDDQARRAFAWALRLNWAACPASAGSSNVRQVRP